MKGSNGKWLLGDSLRRNPDNLMYNHNQDLVKEKMKTGSYATIHVDKFASNSYKWLYFYTIQVSSFAHGIIDSTYWENWRKCQFTVAKKPADLFVQVVQLLRKNEPYTKALNEQLSNRILVDYSCF